MNRTLDNKGISVVEVIVAVFIAGMLSAAIGSFLIMHIKTYEVTQDIIDVQYEAQIALNIMSEIAMESEGIENILDKDGHSLKNKTSASDVALITFKGKEGEYHVFIRDFNNPSDEILYCTTTDTSAVTTFNPAEFTSQATLFARNISSMTLVPGQNDLSGKITYDSETLGDCNSVEIKFNLIDGEAKLTDVKTLAKFRNKRD